MSELWDETTETAELKSWVRSWRQEFFTDLGVDFRLVAHMEKVTVLTAAGSVLGRETLPNLQITAAQCSTDPVLGPLAYQIQSALTALVEELRMRAAIPAGPDMQPIGAIGQ